MPSYISLKNTVYDIIHYYTFYIIIQYHIMISYNIMQHLYNKYKSQLVFAARGAPALSDRNTSRSASCGTPRGNARTWRFATVTHVLGMGIWG